jgi:ketosteroid isomerase-like protein
MEMTEEKIAGIMREWAKDWSVGDVEKMIACLGDDAVWTDPYGTYQGKGAIRAKVSAMFRNFKDIKVTETGNGIMIQGDKAFFEHVLSGFYQGKKFEMLAMCAWEFSGEKVKNMRSVYDRLLIAKQVVSGWPASSFVNMIVKQSEKAMK